MNKETSLTKVKNILKSLDCYPGEWNLNKNLSCISLNKNDINLYEDFLNRYYYLPLDVLFNDRDLLKSFNYGICSLPGNGGRKLFFSKRIFFRNFIPNIDEVINSNGICAYIDIKRSLRVKKDMYRDVLTNSNKSNYYKDILNEYKMLNLDMEFEDYCKISKKKYTKLLNNYNALIDFFDKPIDINKFVSCFNPEQLYLYVCYNLLELNKLYLDLYSRLDFTIKYVSEYIKYIGEERERCSFYNSHIVLDDVTKIYTIDDLVKEYNELLARITK